MSDSQPPDTVRVVVGRIGRAQGLRGEVGVDVRTDVPEKRFAVGRALITDDPHRASLVVAGSRWQGQRFIVRFEGILDRTAAEGLRGLQLECEVPISEQADDPQEFFDWQLTGCDCVTVDGRPLGVVTEVIHLPGQDLLMVATSPTEAATATMVPLVAQIVPSVDIANHRIVLDPPAGLFGDAEAGEPPASDTH